MESVGSSSSPSDHHYNHHRFTPTQLVADRIDRALRHRLRLIHRSESDFFVLGATGNVYTVTLSTTPSCTCPDRTTPCKHILFVIIRVLGISPDDTCLRRRTLRPCQLDRLLKTPSSVEALAGAHVRERFHQVFLQSRQGGESGPRLDVEEGTTCPICLEEVMEKENKNTEVERLVACATCRNVMHEECLVRWKRSRGRRAASCVICRARWRDQRRDHQDKYLNLAAYASEDDGDDRDRDASSLCAG